MYEDALAAFPAEIDEELRIEGDDQEFFDTIEDDEDCGECGDPEDCQKEKKKFKDSQIRNT